MLKKSVKNNYLIFLILITFAFISLLLSAFMPNAFANQQKDTKLKVENHNLVENIQESLKTKTSLSSSCITNKLKQFLLQKNPHSKSEIGEVIEYLYSSILGVDYWDDIAVDFFEKCDVDTDDTKASLISILKNIFKEAKVSLAKEIDESCLALVQQLTDKTFDNFIQDTIKVLWV